MENIYETIRQNLERVKQREDEIAKQEESLKAEIAAAQAKTAEVEAARLEFEEKTAALEKEKLAMSKRPVADEDIVELNVQGEIFSTLRGTLTQFSETRMAYMFSGRWEDKLHLDKNGRIFLDISPKLFRKLLDYLTSRRLAKNATVPLPNVTSEEFPHFKLMLQYFEVETCIYYGMPTFSQVMKSPFIELNADSTIATNTSHGMGYILGHDVYENEIVFFEVEISKLENPWMFVGVMAQDMDGKDRIKDCSFNGNPNAFGWADKGGFWKGGKKQSPADCTIPSGILQEGKIVTMKLDATSHAASLSIRVLPDGKEQLINDLPATRSWRLHINLVSYNDTVRIVKAERLSN